MNFDTSFCMESGQIKTGEDKDDTFAKMLQEVVRVTPSIAFGIASEYPNVLSLVRAFRKHGPLVLEDLYVRFLDRTIVLAHHAIRNLRIRTVPQPTGESAQQSAEGCIKSSQSPIPHHAMSNEHCRWRKIFNRTTT